MTSLEQIIPELRDAIGPVILISGVGLLLLTMTNRLGRAIDRRRPSCRNRRARARARTVSWSCFSLPVCQDPAPCEAHRAEHRQAVLLASALVISLFVGALLQWEHGLMVSLLFIGCMVALCVSLVAFILDINLSLHALKLELEGGPGPKAGSAS